MRIIELFAGIGACSKALENLGYNLEILDAVEIDKYAIKSFNAIHNTNFETQDITKYDKYFEDVDIITHGSPCQDFSLAGKQAGGDIGSGTRSSLMYETIRIVGKIRPKYVLWENVKNLLSKKHKHNFNAYIETMNNLGYKSYYQVLNAKDYGVPQNRERVYTISIRKDIDTNSFIFPEKEELKLRLKDFLEYEVDEKYYLTEEKIDKISHWKAHQKPFEKVQGNNSIVPTLTARGAGEEHSGMITYSDKLEKTTNLQNECLYIKNNTKKGYDKANEGDSINLQYPNSKTRRERVGHQVSQTLMAKGEMGVIEVESKKSKIDVIGNYMPSNHNASRIVNSEGIAPTVKENHGTVTATNINYKIRKLTPKECWRLMGFCDEDFEKTANIPTSNTQLYKQAGNSIVVNVLEKIFKNLLKGEQ